VHDDASGDPNPDARDRPLASGLPAAGKSAAGQIQCSLRHAAHPA